MSLNINVPRYELIIFQDLRSFMDSILTIEADLVTQAIRTLVLNTLSSYRNGLPVKWHDGELAVYLIYIYGEVSKSTTVKFSFA